MRHPPSLRTGRKAISLGVKQNATGCEGGTTARQNGIVETKSDISQKCRT